MHRFFALKNGAQYHIMGQEAAHLCRVLRLKPGDEIEVLDGIGGRALAALGSVSKDECTALFIRDLPSNEPRTRLTLYQGLPKADKLEYIVQKATELGLCAIHPVIMARCDVKPGRQRDDAKAERLARIAQEAAKQCGRANPVQIYPTQKLEALGQVMRAHSLLIVPWEQGGAGFLQAIAEADMSDAAYVIGPEGGMTPDEIDYLAGLGATTVTLGPRILRTETAAIAVASAILCHAGEWS